MATTTGRLTSTFLSWTTTTVGSYCTIAPATTGIVSFNGISNTTMILTNVGLPGQNLDVANKQYVDSVATGLYWKAPVVAASTGSNVPLDEQLVSLDGVTLSLGDRVLLMSQSSAINNGIYVVGTDDLTRANDMAVSDDASGAAVFVLQGTTNADKAFVCTSDPGIVGTDSLVFVQFSSTIEVAGSSTQVQYNTDGELDASPNFTFNDATDTLTVIGSIISTDLTAASWISVGSAVFAGEISGTSAYFDNNLLVGGTIVGLSSITGDTMFTTSLTVYENITAESADIDYLSSIGISATSAEFSGVVIAENITVNSGIEAGSATFTDMYSYDAFIENELYSNVIFTTDLTVYGTFTVNILVATSIDVIGITATSAVFSGAISAGSAVFGPLETEGITATSAVFSAAISAGSAVFGPLNATSAVFSSSIGATSATFSGPIEATSATFSGLVYGVEFIATSDVQFKTNIHRLEDPLMTLNKIEGYTYNWKDTYSKDDRLQVGIIAQQLEEIGLGHLVHGTQKKAVNYNGLIPITIESIKELYKEVQDIKVELAKKSNKRTTKKE